jgi:hypothetical protein
MICFSADAVFRIQVNDTNDLTSFKAEQYQAKVPDTWHD